MGWRGEGWSILYVEQGVTYLFLRSPTEEKKEQKGIHVYVFIDAQRHANDTHFTSLF
jgi:hypothetical protein